MAEGIIKFFHDDRGYGFIETDVSTDDVFFHMDDVEGPELREGERVSFEVEEAEKGPRAVNLRRA